MRGEHSEISGIGWRSIGLVVSRQWQLWGTFSVNDHRRPRAFVSDVLVYDRLIVPVPAEGDWERWKGRNPERQRELLDVLMEGNADRVLEVPWDSSRRKEADEAKARFAAEAAFDVSMINQMPNLDTPAQAITRFVIRDYVDEQNDRRIRQSILRGPPLREIEVVAAYGTRLDFEKETNVVADDGLDQGESDLLGGFVWPFAVPQEDGWSDIDLLKRAVEFANQPSVRAYREAFHQWRADVILNGSRPSDAADRLRESIAEYAEWRRREKVKTTLQAACVVVAVAASVAGAILPVVGLPGVAAAFGAGGALGPWYSQIASRLYKGQLEAFDPSSSPGALFWEWESVRR